MVWEAYVDLAIDNGDGEIVTVILFKDELVAILETMQQLKQELQPGEN